MTSPAPTADAPRWTARGTPEYRRISLGLFLAGFASFSLIYCVQPLLPNFAQDFHVSAAESSLALSLTTGFLAFSILCAGAVAEVLGRRGVMFGSMALAAVLTILQGVLPDWHMLLVVRALVGLVLGGVPAVAMAYLAEEIAPEGLGLSMGLYVGGTAFGGMFGRVGIGALTEVFSWRAAIGVLGAVDLAAAIGFFLLLPTSRNFVRRRSLDAGFHLAAWARHLRTPGLPLLFLTGFLVMGAFVTIYNYATFRLSQAPYGLSESQISLIFICYMLGMLASSLAGASADRVGRGPVMMAGVAIAGVGLLLTMASGLVAIVAGIAVLTVGFFTAHSVASGWVGRLAQGAKGHAASLYLLAYYLGSSFMGLAGGWFWSAGGWPAVTGYTAVLLALAFLFAARLCALARTARRQAAAG